MRGYVVERAGRFYAVIYEGRDPVSGRERRRWHAAGTDRAEAERLASALAAEVRSTGGLPGPSVGRYLLHTWLPRKRVSLRPSTWDYVERRTADGLSKPEIMRCLRRYVAREPFPLIRVIALPEHLELTA